MKLYLVWTGEYEDRTLVSIFQSKEKAEHFIKIYNEIDGAGIYTDGYYYTERTTNDEEFDLTSTVSKYYYACIDCEADGDGILDTDEEWDDFIEFLKPHIELDVATIEPAQYEPILEKLELNVFETEDDYSVPIQKRITGKEVDINVRTRPLYTEKKVIVSDIIVYSRNSYAEARKIALQVYKEYLEKVRNNPEATEFYGQSLIYNADNPNGL